MKIWWSTKAKPWLDKNWQWVVLPVGVLMVAAKALSSRKTTVVGSELTGAAAVEREVNEEALVKKIEAKVELDAGIAEAKQEHAKETRDLTSEQQAKAQELASDPMALNDYLKGIGRSVRK